MKKKCLTLTIAVLMTGSLVLTGCSCNGTGTRKNPVEGESQTDNGLYFEPDFNYPGYGNNPGDWNNPGNNNNNTESDGEGQTVDKFDVNADYSDDELIDDFNAENVFNEDGTVAEGEATDGKNVIYLNGTSINIKGSGMTVSGANVTIGAPGVYYVSGTLNDGQILVDSEEDGTITLVLNGANISCSTSAPIYCAQAELLVVNLVNGTTSTLTDGTTYVYPEETDEPNGCLYCDDDMTINGTGSLVINANFNNGIVAKDILKIANGDIQVKAANNGLKGKDGVVVSGGKITINCSGDGIKSDNTDNADKGYVLIEDGNITITATQDGIQAETCMKITGGDIDILTGKGSGTTSSDSGWGNPYGSGSASTSTVSMKGLKAGTDITVTGGKIKIDSEDDSIHTNATISISGGDITTASGDDGIHSDTELTIAGGTINITKAYEGVESTTINIAGGTTYIVASDDGINAAGGDGSSMNGRPGMNGFSGSSGTVKITGGYLYMNSNGDGLDSNGAITMTGGEIYVDGPTNDGNGALDFDGSFSCTGGTLVAAGSSGMFQYPTCSGDEYCVAIVFTSTQTAKSIVKITDSTGKTIVEYSPAKNFRAFVFSSTKLIKGQTYTVYVNGTEYTTFTVSSSNTTVGSAGGMGGGNVRPGRR